MTDTPDTGSGLSLDQAANAFASILSGGADTQEGGEALSSVQRADDTVVDDAQARADDDHTQSDDDGDPDAGQQQDDTPRYRVKVDGQEVEVPLDELLKGYQRREDYSRKTAEAAEQRKAAEAEFQRVAAERQQYAQTLYTAQQMLAQMMPQEPDWVALSQQDPAEAIRQRALWDRHQQNLAALQAEQDRVAQVQHAQHLQNFQGFVETQRSKLLDALPDWKDGEKAKAERGKLIEWGKKHGYSEPELQSIYDHRHVTTMRKAMLYDEMMARRPEIEAKGPQGPRTMAPGPGQTGKRNVSELTRQKERLAKTGRMEDAAAVFKHFL